MNYDKEDLINVTNEAIIYANKKYDDLIEEASINIQELFKEEGLILDNNKIKSFLIKEIKWRIMNEKEA